MGTPKYLKAEHNGTQIIAPLFALSEAEIEAEKHRQASEIIDGMVARGELIRLQGGRIVERKHYRPEVHGPAIDP